MTTQKEIVLSPTEVGSKDLAVVMQEEVQKRALITQYISHHMKEGADYGKIHIAKDCSNKYNCTNSYHFSKPSLFKPGSEKFMSLFKLTAQFDKDTDTWEMAGSEKGVFAYKCRLLDSKKRMVGEGRGISKLTEKVGWTINNAVKIAEKRAQIDAVLRTGALSDFFTQDLEDMVQVNNQYDQTPVKDDAVPTITYDQDGSKESVRYNPEDDGPHAPGNQVPPKPWAKKPEVVVTEIQKKRQITDLINSIVLHPLEQTAEAYSNWVFSQTGLLLGPASYDEIIVELTKIKNGEK